MRQEDITAKTDSELGEDPNKEDVDAIRPG